ncbi:MAG: DsbC family protein [Desulfuromonas sp.]|nr:DsbC family protein [Desulfuromonas sp.]
MLRLLLVTLLCCAPVSAWCFGGSGCGAGACVDCHSLTPDEAMKLLPPGAEQVTSVKLSDVGGLWEVKGRANDKMFTAYIDFSKKYLIAGRILRLRDGVDLSHSLDVNELNTQGAFLIGDAQAAVKVFVFTDVKCHFCQNMHPELYKVVEQNPQIAFYVQLLPLLTDQPTVNKIVCSGDRQVLDDAMAGKLPTTPDLDCPAVDKSVAFAKRWNIRSTPTLVLPDGKILPGGRNATALLEVLQEYLPAKN